MGHCSVFNVEELSRDKDYKYHFFLAEMQGFFQKNNGLKGKVRMISSGPVSALGPAFITCLLYKTTLPSYSKMILFITLHPEKAFIAFRNHQFIFGIEI